MECVHDHSDGHGDAAPCEGRPRSRFAIVLMTASLLVHAGCRGQSTWPPPDESGTGPVPALSSAQPEACDGVGTPWSGAQGTCLYEVDGCCYEDARAACRAAQCPPDACQVLEVSPAQLSCHSK